MENIVILGLDYEYNIKVGKTLSDDLGMFFLDFKEYVEYNLFSRKDMLEKCGKGYLALQERKCVASASEFENTVICMPYSYFCNEDAHKLFTSAYKVYLYFSKNKLKKLPVIEDTITVDLITFSDRDEDITKVCNLKICVGNKKIATICRDISKNVEVKNEH